jgi:chromosomal replication initiator protein
MQPDFLAVAQAGDEHSLARELTIPSCVPGQTGVPGDVREPVPVQQEPTGDASDRRLAEVGKALLVEVGERNFRHWFADRTSITIAGSTVRVAVAGSFLLTWMQRRFGSNVQDAVRRVIPESSVEWSVAAQAGTLPLPDDAGKVDSAGRAEPESSPAEPAVVQAGSGKVATRKSATGKFNLCVSPDETPQESRREADSCSPTTADRSGSPHELRRFRDLVEFVAGPCNELAVTAARQVAQHPGERYSPLFLHGGVGTGKTHLAEGIYREVRRKRSELRTVFMTSEQFTNQFTSALRSHTLPAFRQRFRSVDVLIVDDVGFLGGKRVIQEEFLHTFKQLESHGRQVVITCDTHPRLMTGASEELISRFLCGLVCRLETPDADTRRKIVQARSVMLDAEFDEAALDYISRRFVTSVRELEGALNTLETWHSMTGRRVTLNAAKTVLADLERDCVRVVKLPEIEAAVSNLFALQQSDLKSGRRTKSVSQPRMLAMFLARRHTQAAYKEIGEFFGGRNHSTVIAAEKKVEGWLQTSGELKIGGRSWQLSDLVETLEQQLMAG